VEKIKNPPKLFGYTDSFNPYKKDMLSGFFIFGLGAEK